jgi:hypothetical protein
MTGITPYLLFGEMGTIAAESIVLILPMTIIAFGGTSQQPMAQRLPHAWYRLETVPCKTRSPVFGGVKVNHQYLGVQRGPIVKASTQRSILEALYWGSMAKQDGGFLLKKN